MIGQVGEGCVSDLYNLRSPSAASTIWCAMALYNATIMEGSGDSSALGREQLRLHCATNREADTAG